MSKKPKYAVWELMFWNRNIDPEIRVLCGEAIRFKKYYLDNVTAARETYYFFPEKVWYSVEDAHIEANSIYKELLGSDLGCDLLGITVVFFSKEPVVDKNGWITKNSWKYKVAEKHFMYTVGGRKNGS